MTVARRGEVWLVDLGMAAKVRPAVVVSVPADDTDRALVTIVPHTTSPRQSRFEATVLVPFLRPGVFDAQNLVTIPHVKTGSTPWQTGKGAVRNRRASDVFMARAAEPWRRS